MFKAIQQCKKRSLIGSDKFCSSVYIMDLSFMQQRISVKWIDTKIVYFSWNITFLISSRFD